MAKEQFNCRLREEVKALIKAEASRLSEESGRKVSDADVVEQAVIAFVDATPRVYVNDIQPAMQAPVSSLRAVERASESARTFEAAKDGHCRHCGQDFELVPGAPPTSMCRDCVRAGHRNDANCMKCAEREFYAKKRSKDSICDDSNIDYAAFND